MTSDRRDLETNENNFKELSRLKVSNYRLIKFPYARGWMAAPASVIVRKAFLISDSGPLILFGYFSPNVVRSRLIKHRIKLTDLGQRMVKGIALQGGN